MKDKGDEKNELSQGKGGKEQSQSKVRRKSTSQSWARGRTNSFQEGQKDKDKSIKCKYGKGQFWKWIKLVKGKKEENLLSKSH